MKVLMIAPTPFMADRGCHTQILLEIKSLQSHGHDVLLCTYGLGRDVEGVRTVRTVNMPWYRKLSAGPSKTKILLLPFLTVTALKTIVRFRPDVVHAHLHEGAVIAWVCRWFFPRLRYVFDMQGSLSGECVQHGFVREGGLGHRFLRWVERRIASWFPTLTQSDSMVKELETLGVPPQRITNVKDGVDTELFRPMAFDEELGRRHGIDPSRPRVLYMGLLETYQGVDLLLEAFSRVSRRAPETQFIVIGYPNVERYEARAKELGILESTRFLGRIDYFILPRYLSLSPIAVAPKIALTEGDGKIYNYMAMGMAVVAFDRSVSREILGPTGIYAEMRNADDLARKILDLVGDPTLVRQKGASARERAVRELSWSAVGQRILSAYQRIEGRAA